MNILRCYAIINFRDGAHEAFLNAIDLGSSYRVVLRWFHDPLVADQGLVPEEYVDVSKDEVKHVTGASEGHSFELRYPICINTLAEAFDTKAATFPE